MLVEERGGVSGSKSTDGVLHNGSAGSLSGEMLSC